MIGALENVSPFKLWLPIGSMYGIFTYIWLNFVVNVGKYTIRGSYGLCFKTYVKKICGKNTSCPSAARWFRRHKLGSWVMAKRRLISGGNDDPDPKPVTKQGGAPGSSYKWGEITHISNPSCRCIRPLKKGPHFTLCITGSGAPPCKQI